MSKSSSGLLDDKAFVICNVQGGLDVTRVVSSNARQIFGGAAEDVELMREYVSQAASNGGISGGFSDLGDLGRSLQWRRRGLPRGTTTVDAGLGYVDDRPGRSMDRYASINNAPTVGDKQTDMRIIDAVSNLFPWIVDRRSLERRWYTPHQNGRSEGPAKGPFPFASLSLYTAAWIGTNGSAWAYYPPLSVFGNGHPFGMGDVVGGFLDAAGLPFVSANLPENNPSRRVAFADPYPDVARPGLSLITAMAPVYFTGIFGNFAYNDTYIASTGVDISVASTSSLLDVLLDRMTASSFAVLVNLNFDTIVLSQTVVERLYPPLTGMEEIRITRSDADGSILEDRRNRTYLVSDTIHEGLAELKNADWEGLREEVRQARPGTRSYSRLNLTLTGEEGPTEFYAMYDRWPYVADWVLLAFAPVDDVEHAVDVGLYSGDSSQNETSVTLAGEWGRDLFGEAILVNRGSLDVKVTTNTVPAWFVLVPDNLKRVSLASGGTLPLQFNVDTSQLEIGMSSFLLTFAIQDDDYPDCFHNHDVRLSVSVKVTPKDCAALTGDRMRVADAHGLCVCSTSSIGIFGKCYSYTVVFLAVSIPLILLLLVGVYFYVEHKRMQSDSVWLIRPSELTFDTPSVILGRGTFGMVVQGQYRGTIVAVKRVIPPRTKQQNAFTGVTLHSNRNSKMESIEEGGESSDEGVESNRTQQSSDELSFASNTARSSESWLKLNLRNVSSSGSSASDNGGNANQSYNQLRASFIEEMRFISKLRHPCITTVMGAVISARDEPLLVMELMDHGSLFDILHNETMHLDGDLVLKILRDISQGLRFLHAAKPQVIHGDLKTQNVLVDSKFRAKVADFGMSLKVTTWGLSQKKAAGTPFWMAPELLRGESTNTAASDVFSFGIVLYELYSRRIPYDEELDPDDDIIRRVCDPLINMRPAIPEHMPPEIVTLMAMCTNPIADARPSLSEIDDNLKSFNAGDVEPGKMSLGKKYWDSSLTDTEKLLLEIFPKHVAEALSKGWKVDPEHFECVTIFFSDIVGFTTIASEMSALKVSDMLDRLYIKFDGLSRLHDVFKVETIGDLWMGVTNLASAQLDHAKRIAAFAIDAIRAANATLIDEGDEGKGFLNIRVGFHSGPVIATVVGSRNPKYTLIGDTVNTSSRMESNSLPGRILCSQRAAALLRQQTQEFSLRSRGVIEVKGKGAMETFWVGGSKIKAAAADKPRNNHVKFEQNATEITPLLRVGYSHIF